MSKSDWIWMGHAGHFILGHRCRFHLATYVNGHIISTVGELWNERSSREIHASIYDPEWLKKHRELKGDHFDNEYMKRFGFEAIGCNKDDLYESMVFKAEKTKNKCCPYAMESGAELKTMRYKTADEATEGHYKLCEKYDKMEKNNLNKAEDSND